MGNNGYLRQAVTGMDLPVEMLSKIPIVEVYGKHRVFIENHYGVMSYSGCEISAKSKCGVISIYGSRLEIVKMTRFQLVITGEIESVSFGNRR